MENIRIGKVSKVDYDKAQVEVLYEDRDNQVTAGLPYLYNGEYNMPAVGDMVIVVHLSNGTAMGIVLGTYTNKNNISITKGKGIFYKVISKMKGAFIKHDDSSGTLTIKAEKIVLSCNDQDVDVSALVKRVEDLEKISELQQLGDHNG